MLDTKRVTTIAVTSLVAIASIMPASAATRHRAAAPAVAADSAKLKPAMSPTAGPNMGDIPYAVYYSRLDMY